MKILSFITVLLGSFQIWAMSCENLFSPLNSYQRALLDHARFLGEHDYKVLKVNVDGVKKNVIILEENSSHTKNSSDAGKAIIKSFNFYGLEGYNPELYFGSKAISRHFNKFLKFLNKHNKRLSMSDIRTLNFFKNNNNYKMTRQEVLEPLIQEGQAKGFRDFKEDRYLVVKPNEVLTYLQLEAGHRPNVYEHLHSGAITLWLSAFAFQIGAMSLAKFHQVPSTEILAQMAAANAVLISGYYYFAGLLHNSLQSLKNPLKLLFGEGHPLRFNRDKTMANNIIEGFRKNDFHDTMLVIVSNGHMHGIENHLFKLDVLEK